MKFDPRLSGIRGLAASGVVLNHLANLEGWSIQNSFWGITGIETFLILSMFLLLRTLDADPSPRRYIRRRILRIWPAYFGACLAVFLLYDRNPAHLLGTMFFVSLYIPSLQFSFLPWAASYVFWTLQVEEQAYLFIPLIHRLSTARKELVALGLFGVSGIFGAGAILSGGEGLFANAYGLPPVWLAAYGAGILAYTGRLRRWLDQPPVAIGTVALLAPLFAWIPSFTTYILVTSPVLAALVASPMPWLGRFPLLVLGESSYSLYLTHCLWLGEFGLLGLPLAFPAALAVELASRPRGLLARLRRGRGEGAPFLSSVRLRVNSSSSGVPRPGAAERGPFSDEKSA